MGSRSRGGGKLPGKTAYSGRRRSTTRRSGFKSHPDATGGQCREDLVPTYWLVQGDTVVVNASISHNGNAWLGYGGWFLYDGDVRVEVQGGPSRRTLTSHGANIWNKVGCLWEESGTSDVEIQVTFTAISPSRLALYEFDAGTVSHDALEILGSARDALQERLDAGDLDAEHIPLELTRAERFLGEPEPILANNESARKAVDRIRRIFRNNFEIAPEGCFYVTSAEPVVDAPDQMAEDAQMLLKSCNRCARYLPVNAPPNERYHLSFSNHCVAADRRPCSHTGFGRLTDESGNTIQLDYGYQLECRFCKKYFVNTAHNHKRTAAQMKEDGARRRAFEKLLAELYQGSPQLRYRLLTNRELTDDVWNRFNGRCFNCNVQMKSAKEMHLDHTRPLKLMWPLDRL